MSTGPTQLTAYGSNQPLINVFPPPIIANRDPSTTDKAYPGTIWINKNSNAVYILTQILDNVANWASLSGGSGSFVNLVIGNMLTVLGTTFANEIIASGPVQGSSLAASSGGISSLNANTTIFNKNANATLIPLNTSYLISSARTNGTAAVQNNDALGSYAFNAFDGTNYITSAAIVAVIDGTVATNRVPADLIFFTHADAANPNAVERMIIHAAGNVEIETPDAGVGLTVDGGGIVATGGPITAGTSVYAAGDGGGIATQTALTNVTNTTQGGGTLSIASTDGNDGNNEGFIKIYVGTTVAYIPYFTNIAP